MLKTKHFMKKILLTLSLFIFLSTNAQNNAFTFNGIDQQIATYTGQTNVQFTNQNFTIEAWVKPAAFVNSTGDFEHTILGNDSSNTTGYVLRTGGSRKLDFTFGNGTSWYSVTSANPVFTVGEWTHVAVVRNGTSFTLYANGVQVAQQTFAQNIALPNTNLRIAESPGFNGRFFNGSLDEIKIWNTARTVAEVRNDLSATTTPLPTELLVYFKMDQTTGQAVVSETAVNLFAQYLPTAQVNSGAGFFRTYTFIGGFTTSNLWSDAPNWINGFVPNHIAQESGDIINITENCRFNTADIFTISTGVTLNNTTLDKIFNIRKLSTTTNPPMVFTINGTVNNKGIIAGNFLSNSQNNINGVLNNKEGGIYYFHNMVINGGGFFNNNGGFNDPNTPAGIPASTGNLTIMGNGTLQCGFASYGFLENLTNNSDGLMSSNSSLGIQVYDTFTNYGVVNVNNSSKFTVDLFTFNYGTITNDRGEIILQRNVLNSGTINNNFIIKYSSRYRPNNFFRNTGTINNIGETSRILITTSGSLLLNEGICYNEGWIDNNGVFQNEATLTFKNIGAFSNISFYNNSGANFINNGTHISSERFNNSGSFSNTGIHTGNGDFFTTLFTNPSTATIAPSTNTGTGIGTLNFTNSLTNNGNVNIEIGGTTAGSSYDVVNVTGTATLGGTLNVNLINSFIPVLGTTDFVIMNYTSRTGSFATINYPNIAGIVWSLIYNSTNVVLRAESTLSNQEFETISLKTYPNPIKNILNIISPLEMESLKIFNLLGQEVLSKEVNGTETNLDISNLANGTYILKTIVNGVAKTVKIVKA